MNRSVKFSAVIERGETGFVAHCPELDVVSQGDSFDTALANITEAVELFLETASETEIQGRLNEADKPLRVVPLELTHA